MKKSRFDVQKGKFAWMNKGRFDVQKGRFAWIKKDRFVGDQKGYLFHH